MTSDFKIEALEKTPLSGQHCGTIPTGVKVTHVPTGLTASCNTERSQMKNRDIAMAMIEYGLTFIL